MLGAEEKGGPTAKISGGTLGGWTRAAAATGGGKPCPDLRHSGLQRHRAGDARVPYALSLFTAPLPKPPPELLKTHGISAI